MRKVNTGEMSWFEWFSPKGTFGGYGLEISEELGRKPLSTDLLERHPFDVEIVRLPPGKTLCPYHSHSMQWEFYHVTAGTGTVRHEDGVTAVVPGDAFLFKPGQAHTIVNDSESELVFYCIADNPIGESCYYPDSKKWLVRDPERTLIRSDNLDYFDGEE